MSEIAELLERLPKTAGSQRAAVAQEIMELVAETILQAAHSTTQANPLVWSRVDPVDVVTLVTERLYLALLSPENEWESPEHLKNYFYKIAKNAAIDCYRQAIAQKRGPTIQSAAGLDQAVDSSPTAEAEQIRIEEAQAVRDALALWTPDDQELIRQRVEWDWSFAQIAAARGESFSTTYRRFHAILTKLGISLGHLE
jgi:RNA polymerase sigma factor (sigma-70 family)